MKKVLLAIQVEGELPFDGMGKELYFPAFMSNKYVYAKISKDMLPLINGEYIEIRRFDAPDITKKFKRYGLRVNIRKFFVSEFCGLYRNPETLPLSDKNSFHREVMEKLDELDDEFGEFATDIQNWISDLSNAFTHLNYLQSMYMAKEIEGQ